MLIDSSGSFFRKTNIYISESLAVLAKSTKLLLYTEVHVIKFTYDFIHIQIKHLIFKLNLNHLTLLVVSFIFSLPCHHTAIPI